MTLPHPASRQSPAPDQNLGLLSYRRVPRWAEESLLQAKPEAHSLLAQDSLW